MFRTRAEQKFARNDVLTGSLQQAPGGRRAAIRTGADGAGNPDRGGRQSRLGSARLSTCETLHRGGCGGRTWVRAAPKMRNGRNNNDSSFRTKWIDERSECRGRLRTMPRKEEKDKRSAVKNLFGARLQMFRCARHDICGRSLQRGKRQTKCNQESIRVRLQILRRYPLLRMTTLVVPIVAPRMTK